MAELGGQTCHSINMIFPYFLVFFWELPNFSALSMFLSCFLSPASHKYPHLSSEYPPEIFHKVLVTEANDVRPRGFSDAPASLRSFWQTNHLQLELFGMDWVFEIRWDTNRVTISSLSQSVSLAQSSLLLISTQPHLPPSPQVTSNISKWNQNVS